MGWKENISSDVTENFSLLLNRTKVKQPEKVWELEEKCENANISVLGLWSPLSNTVRYHIRIDRKHTLNKKRRGIYRKCVQKIKKQNKKALNFIRQQQFYRAAASWCTMGCLANNAMTNGEFILRFLFSSSPRWVKWFPQRCAALLTSQGERKKKHGGWRIIAQLVSLYSCN